MNTSELTIRVFDASDEAAVIDLWVRCGLTAPTNDPAKDIARTRAVQQELFLVGEVNRVVAAALMGGYDGHRGWVYYVAVDPDQQRKGYGGQLMAALEARLSAMGCPKLNLQIREGNDQVAAFYRALGFGNEPRISMGKRLIPDE